MINRRKIIKLGATGWLLSHASPLAYANTPSARQPKIVWIVLRGAMDSLHAVVPTSDPDLKKHRADLINPIIKNVLPLNKDFSLHPELKTLHQWYQQKQMAPVVAVASHRTRSHFEAQDKLESGLTGTDYNDGWLARAFQSYQMHYQTSQQTTQKAEALAIARSIPLSLRGKLPVSTVYPSTLPDAEADLYDRLAQLYQDEPLLSERLQAGLNTRDMLSEDAKKSKRANFPKLAKMCGELLNQQKNTRCAMLEMSGWDTHNAQVNRLNRQFKTLDSGLKQLKQGLGKTWDDTIVVLATEFGRTVAINGSGGTDHGTGSALFLAGGCLNGGQVFGQWPGLSKSQLYQGRDLQPTSDTRSWLATILQQHWQLTHKELATVFPNINIINKQLIS
ncbi:DUF1501 domain-containing protein [Pseudomonadales bacterium]|nr:DUF1501 domain-containing protein [Pseudomonadales bacterium]